MKSLPVLMYGWACAMAGAWAQAYGLPWRAVLPMAILLGVGAHLAYRRGN